MSCSRNPSRPLLCTSPGRIAGNWSHLNINPVQAENVPIFCLKFGAYEDGWAKIGTFSPCCKNHKALLV